MSAEEVREDTSATSQKTQSVAEKSLSVTRHTIEIESRRLEYTATAGTVEVEVKRPNARGRVFFVAYTMDDVDPGKRPITFIFNGGPGAASAYLHLLALGPRIVALADDGTIPRPPARIVDNPLTWLKFTDLVFIDPVGTGFSQAVKARDNEKARDREKDREADASRLWSVTQDLEAISEFIRLHLTQTQRWRSPKFLAGESYGGFRAASLAKRLASLPGVRLNGIILISPLLEFSQQQFNSYRLLPWASLLPVYAATALHHAKLGAPGEVEKVLAEVEAFSMGEYLLWLANEDAPEGGDVPRKLARYLGLSRDLVVQHRGRIPRSVFAKELLRDSRRILSLYDGTVTGIDPHPETPTMRADDPILEGLIAPLTSAFNSYVRGELGYETGLPYLVLNPEVSRKWDWTSGTRTRRGAVGAADSLKEAMSLNPDLMVLVAHGSYDMVTPYLSTKFTVRQMALDPAIRSNLIFKTYEGGHMLYTHAAARTTFYKDAGEFYKAATANSN